MDEASLAVDSLQDSELLAWLIRFSSRFLADPNATSDAQTWIRAERGSPRYRAILVLLIGIASETQGQGEFLRSSLSNEDVLAGAAVRALLLRSAGIRPGEPLQEWLRSFWLGALADQDLGPLLAPGLVECQSPSIEATIYDEVSSGSPEEGPGEYAWYSAGLRADDSATRKALDTVIETGKSPVARIIALAELPVDSETDRLLPQVLQNDGGSSLLRALAYEHFTPEPANWPFYERGLATESDSRVLQSVAVFALLVVPPESRSEMVRLVEQIASRVELDGPLTDRVTRVLSSSETREGLDALSRMARLARSTEARVAAVIAIAECAYGTAYSRERIAALVELLQSPDPVVDASAASALLTAERGNALGVAAHRAIEGPVRERIQAIALDPHVPERLRQAIAAQLRAAASQPPR